MNKERDWSVLASRVYEWLGFAVALSALHLSLTFMNVWPTLKVRAGDEFSVEVAVAVLSLVCVASWRRKTAEFRFHWLSGIWVLLVLGRYIDVTTRSLYGRDVNLYWDLRHVPKVGAMFTTVASVWETLLVVFAAIMVPVVIYLSAYWCFTRIFSVLRNVHIRRSLGVAASAICLLYVLDRVGVGSPLEAEFSDPVSIAGVEEVYEYIYEMTGAGVAALGPPQLLSSDFEHVQGADVVLVFMESYGAVSWEAEHLAADLAPSRSKFEEDVVETGRNVVSALVESTTFGGESWLAHISLLSGIEIRDDRANARLMAQDRDTLVKLFGRQGYRTVAIMPGHLQAWPEGAFYGFDEIYDHGKLDYEGPPFGWWSVTDQYALARVDSEEMEPKGVDPRFVVFTTLSTHAPFTPAPPYQPDWSRVLTDQPYDSESLDRAWSDWPDWFNLGPSYVKALGYAYQTFGGYLRFRAERDLVMILIGDHQPPALVSGEEASWNVPIHVVTNRQRLLEKLQDRHFVEGLDPRGPVVARMDTLLPILLEAFGNNAGISRASN